jgi:hypothetical protein
VGDEQVMKASFLKAKKTASVGDMFAAEDCEQMDDEGVVVMPTNEPRDISFMMSSSEMVALFAHLNSCERYYGSENDEVLEIKRRLAKALSVSLRQAQKTVRIVDIVRELTKNMKADAYIRRQERKIEQLRTKLTDSESIDEEGEDQVIATGPEAAKLASAPDRHDKIDDMSEKKAVNLNFMLDDDDEPAREYPSRSSAPKPSMPHFKGKRHGRRRWQV